MWIKPDFTGTLEDLTEEVKSAVVKFEQDKSDGTATPIGDEVRF